ncbi:MAG: hypothetical protein JRI68_19240 [Deltaproteobacteria bacterium]|nr:hypothetical protein [Deltaproteobacteria bacterium]
MPVSVEVILSAIVFFAIIGGLFYLLVKTRRWLKADRAARATPLGELVQVRSGAGCSLCHSLLDDLADVAAVYESQARSSKPLTGLWLEQVHLRSGSLEPLGEMELCTFLKLDTVPAVHDVAPLAGLTQLEELIIHHCPIRDVTPLAGMTQLRELSLAFTPVADLAPLAGLTSLTELDLRRTEITDLAPLANLTQLQLLRTAGSPLAEGAAQALQQALPQVQIDPY